MLDYAEFKFLVVEGSDEYNRRVHDSDVVVEVDFAPQINVAAAACGIALHLSPPYKRFCLFKSDRDHAALFKPKPVEVAQAKPRKTKRLHES